ncbi:hypothetical protein SDC9_170172 [bioreactor metagenome]|uniref:Uncharacterized protein n=1 Tax=bioreactor metagenome TaxID=1076179 RepID=A0A645G7C2_9ZZZZ
MWPGSGEYDKQLIYICYGRAKQQVPSWMDFQNVTVAILPNFKRGPISRHGNEAVLAKTAPRFTHIGFRLALQRIETSDSL